MDGTYGGWRDRQGIQDGMRPMRELRVVVEGKPWSFRGFMAAMEVGSSWLANERPAMLKLIKTWNNYGGGRKREHPERTLASYIFQEAEGISREAKIWWARARGHVVHNLQHDGIIMELTDACGKEEAEKILTGICSRALRYPQPVECKG